MDTHRRDVAEIIKEARAREVARADQADRRPPADRLFADTMVLERLAGSVRVNERERRAIRRVLKAVRVIEKKDIPA